jgi:hypothetical protein
MLALTYETTWRQNPRQHQHHTNHCSESQISSVIYFIDSVYNVSQFLTMEFGYKTFAYTGRSSVMQGLFWNITPTGFIQCATLSQGCTGEIAS